MDDRRIYEKCGAIDWTKTCDALDGRRDWFKQA